MLDGNYQYKGPLKDKQQASKKLLFYLWKVALSCPADVCVENCGGRVQNLTHSIGA